MKKDNKIYNEANVIYDGDDYIVVKPLTTESILYFTDGNKDYAKLFERYKDDEDTYLVVDKRDTPVIFYGIQNNNGNIRIYYFNSLNKFDGHNFENIDISDFNTSIPSVVRDSINPFLYEGTIYGILKDIKNGKDFSLDDISQEDYDHYFHKWLYYYGGAGDVVSLKEFVETFDADKWGDINIYSTNVCPCIMCMGRDEE